MDLLRTAIAPPQHGEPQSTKHASVLRTAKPKNYGQIVAGLALMLVLAIFAIQLAQNPNIRYDAIARYLFDERILSGVRNTVILALLSQLLACVLGAFLAIMRLSSNKIASVVAWLYIWVFRGTPLIVQLIFWFNLALVVPTISLSIPGTNLHLFEASTNQLITPFMAAILGLFLNEAAYMAEIIRAGILSVDSGQREAAQALAMRPWTIMRNVTLPQAVRVVVPPTGNEMISMLKSTAIVSVISYSELMTQARDIYTENLMTLELLVVASIWYLVIVTVLGVAQNWLERRVGRGFNAEREQSDLRRFVRSVARISGRGPRAPRASTVVAE